MARPVLFPIAFAAMPAAEKPPFLILIKEGGAAAIRAMMAPV